MPDANSKQVGGEHYKNMAIQPWDYIYANRLGFFEGSIIAYISRWRAKGGIEDLKKAAHFLDKLIEETLRAEPVSVEAVKPASASASINSLAVEESLLYDADVCPSGFTAFDDAWPTNDKLFRVTRGVIPESQEVAHSVKYAYAYGEGMCRIYPVDLPASVLQDGVIVPIEPLSVAIWRYWQYV